MVVANQDELLNPLDIKILEILQENGRISNVQLAGEVGLSPSAVLERVRKLEERGFIKKYAAIVDNKKVGLATVAFVAVSLNLHQKDAIENFHRFVQECAKVLECYHLAGAEDYLLKVYSKDIDDYEDFLLNTLTRTKGIDRIRTMFVLSTLKRETALPIKLLDVGEGEGSGSSSGSSKKAQRGKRNRGK